MISQLQKAMANRPQGLIAAILVFLMLAADITTAATASGTPRTLNASLPENSPAGTSLGTPMETTAPAGTVSYSLSGTDAELFNIDPATGEITLAQNFSKFELRTERQGNNILQIVHDLIPIVDTPIGVRQQPTHNYLGPVMVYNSVLCWFHEDGLF